MLTLELPALPVRAAADPGHPAAEDGDAGAQALARELAALLTAQEGRR